MGDSTKVMRQKRVRMTDVAREAGVSLGTVSAVVNNLPTISPETRNRVLEVIERTKYTPDLSARLLARSRRTCTVLSDSMCLAITEGAVDGFSNQFFARLLSGVTRETSECKLKLFSEIIKIHYSTSTDLPASMSEGMVGGVICAGMINTGFVRQIVAMRIPVVLVEGYFKDTLLPSILADNYRGGYLAAKYLLERGHRAVALMSGHEDFESTRERRRGFLDGLREAGVELPAAFFENGSFDLHGGAASMQRLLALPDRPTAVFCMNDQMAIGAMKAVKAAGLRVPEDVSLIGFDDIFMAGHMEPALTTIRVPLEDMGRMAVRTLRGLMREPGLPPATSIVSVVLVERGSVRDRR